MARAHQQAWIWQDEWVGLTMDDIRKLELETQEYLRQRMAGQMLEGEEKTKELSKDDHKVDDDSSISFTNTKKLSQFSVNQQQKSLTLGSRESEETIIGKRKSSQWSRTNSRSTLHSPGDGRDVIQAWRIATLERRDSEEDDSDEFYDAEDQAQDDNFYSMEERLDTETDQDNIFSRKFIQQMQSNLLDLNKIPVQIASSSYFPPESPSPSSPTIGGCAISTLIIVIHGGNVLDVSNDQHKTARSLDISTFKNTMESIICQYYTNLIDRIKVLSVACPPICRESLAVLSSLSPFAVEPTNNPANNNTQSSSSFSSIPVGALPLFAISSHNYQDHISTLTTQCNKVYAEFIKSEEGRGFRGKVVLIGDSVGAILGFDALCQSNTQSNNGPPSDQSSLQDPQEISTFAGKSFTPVISVSECELGEQTISKYSTMPYSSISNNSKNNTATCGGSTGQAKTQVYCKSLSHPGDGSTSDNSNRLLINNNLRRRSSGSSDPSTSRFDFEVHDFFMFGSMIGVVLTYRKMLSLDDKSCKLCQSLPLVFITIVLFFYSYFDETSMQQFVQFIPSD